MREKEFLPLVRERLGIERLNAMQEKMLQATSEGGDIMLLSATGSGKTLAFVMSMLKIMKPSSGRVQGVIIVPSRELVIQISGVIRAIAAGLKTTSLYGGHKVEDEVNSLHAGTDIIVATPGRLLDHINRRNIDVMPTRVLVLDEFDKSLELGFEKEMKKISSHLKNVSRTILTSATRAAELPDFLTLRELKTLDYLEGSRKVRERTRVWRVDSDVNDKLETLKTLLQNIAAERGKYERSIIFVNHRESAERTAQYLKKSGIPTTLYHGALEQRDRESAIALFNNGTGPVMVATDLAARGLDIEGVKHVIHYHQPLSAEVYTHRNGRTARVEEDGDVYVIIGPAEDQKEYIEVNATRHLERGVTIEIPRRYESLYISAGKREKISAGDVVGYLIKEGGLTSTEIGKINVYDHYIIVAIDANKAPGLAESLKKKKLKGKSIRITQIKS